MTNLSHFTTTDRHVSSLTMIVFHREWKMGYFFLLFFFFFFFFFSRGTKQVLIQKPDWSSARRQSDGSLFWGKSSRQTILVVLNIWSLSFSHKCWFMLLVTT